MAISSSFSAVLNKHQEAQSSVTALSKVSKVIEQITKIVKENGYASVDAFNAEVEAIASGKPLKAKRGPKAKAASTSPKATKGKKGPRPRFTDEDRAHWKSVYEGEANHNQSLALRLLKKQGKPVSPVTFGKEAKNWPKKAAIKPE